jgi:YgiT-type zinc finger domain-containing protein
MVRQTAPFYIDQKDVHLSLDEVSAWVCTQCGEPYSEATEVDSMQAILRVADEQVEKLARST